MKRFFMLLLLLTLAVPRSWAQDELNTGLIFTDPEEYQGIGVAALPLGAGEVPPRKDLSQWMPPVGDQSPQNSCVAWAVAYAARSFYEKKEHGYSYYNGSQVDYRRIFSPSYVYNQINGGANRGTHFVDAFNVMIKEGVCTYQTMPYQGQDWRSQPNAQQESEAARFKIDTYRRLDLYDPVSSIKAELISENPVIAASIMDLTYYQGGYHASGGDHIWRSVGQVDGRMGHAILIVGYDDQKGAFKFMNSWGTRWGNEGYGWISYNIVKEVLRELYIIKPHYSGDPSPTQPTQEYITTTNDQLTPADINNAGLNFTIQNVVHQNDMNARNVPVQMRQMMMQGFVSLPPNLGRQAQVVVNFYVNNNGQKGQPVGSLNYNFALANGQAATGTPVINLNPNQPLRTTWQAAIPYAALNVPRGGQVATPWGPRYQPATSYLIAEPVLFVDGFPIRTGQQIQFFVAL